MQFAALLFLSFPALIWTGSCRSYSDTLECMGVSKDDFLPAIFKQREGINKSIIIISNSNLVTIVKFPDLEYLLNATIHTIEIHNSSIRHISDGAFSWMYSLTTLDLSENHLEDFTFVNSLPRSINNLILSNNKLTEVNLFFLPLYRGFGNLDISRNNISSIHPWTDHYNLRIENLDLSYNQLAEFNETFLRTDIGSLNLSYNNPLTDIVINNDKDVLTLRGNNITINSVRSLTVRSFISSFLPNKKLSIRNKFSIDNVYLGSLTKENPLKVSNTDYYSYDMDLSNTSLSYISEYYFQHPDSHGYLRIHELNLSHNNLSVLHQPLFLRTNVAILDLSYSKIRSITRDAISGLFTKYINLKELNLTGNYLENLEDICPDVPTFENGLETIDLSLNMFQKFDKKSIGSCTSLKSLNLSKCLITSVNFSGSYVERLDLSENKIVHVGSDDFASMTKLVELKLDANEISTIDTHSFNSLSNLKTLDLSDNVIENIERNAFSNLSSIVTINLANNRLKILKSDVFIRLSVKNIFLQGNEIRFMESKAFDGLYNLRMLNLSAVGLTTLENEVFYDLKALDSLDLSNNNLTILGNSTFKDSSLRYLNLSGNRIEEIRSGAFRNLNNLINLNLSSQRINRLDPFAFSYMNLESMDLRNNNLTGISPEVFSYVVTTNLYLDGISETVNFDNTVAVKNLSLQINGVFKENTIQNVYLKYLYLENSHIDLLKNNCFLAYSLEQLHLVNSSIRDYEPKALSGLFRLLHLDASSIFRNSNVLKANVFEDLNSLETLKLSDTNISVIEDGGFSGLSSLRDLCLDGNKLRSINKNALIPLGSTLHSLDISRNPLSINNSAVLAVITNSLPHLKTLNASSCGLTVLKFIDEYNLPSSLENLYLSDNHIFHLPSNIFRYFPNLTTLFLNRNRIRSIGLESLSSTNKLKVLRLDSNELEAVGPGIVEGFRNLEFLDISQNTGAFKDSSLEFLFTLRNLDSLYLDLTELGDDFEYIELKTYFPRLKRIGINYNRFSCSALSKIIMYLDDSRIDYVPRNLWFANKSINAHNSINGVACTY